MAWFDREQEASYKGFVLYIKSITQTGGKKGQDSDYAEQDGGGAEDLGANQRKFTITGVIGGDNYDIDRDTLLNTLTDRGTGDLVLPTSQDTITALAERWSFTEGSIENAGVVDYSISFVEVSQSTLPITVASISSSDLNRDGALDAIGAVLSNVNPLFILEKTTETLDDIQRSIANVANPLYIANAQLIRSTQSTLAAANPATLFSSFINLQRSVIDGERTIREGVNVLSSAWIETTKDLPSTRLNPQEKIGECKTIECVGASSVVATAQAILDTVYELREEAFSAIIALRELYELWRTTMHSLEEIAYDDDSLLDQNRYISDAALLHTVQDITFRAVQQVEQNAGSLAGTQIITISQDTTPIVLAFDLYADPSRATQLIDDNTLLDPTLIKKGTSIIYRSA